MAAYINEVHFSPLFGNTAEDQYVEIRGEPGQLLASGTYFVAIGNADGVTELGDVHAIFDLSSQALGSNGILVIVPSASGYAIDSAARVLRGSDGFTGLSSGAFSADGASKQIRTGSSTFLLIQTNVAPTLSIDIDTNDDGTPETAYPNWTILDGVSYMHWVDSTFPLKSYAPIVFRDRGVGQAMPGATVVNTDALGYVGRIGDSTGYAAGDWMAGNTVEIDQSWRFQLQELLDRSPSEDACSIMSVRGIGTEAFPAQHFVTTTLMASRNRANS